MKLLKCHIENFGKLQNFDYNFKDNLNIIKEENGFGKTTFANFIKAMFYGLDTTNSAKSDRKIYMPWQGGTCGGNIEFEIQGKKYRIERIFEKKAKDDIFKLYDLETNLESSDYTSNIGEEIFKINKEAYERSTYIPQGEIQIQMDDSISAKLGNVLESGNDINTSEMAIKKLEDTMKLYVKTGNRGIINENISKLNELKRNLENSKSDEENIEIRRNKLKETIQQIKQKEELKEKKQKELNEKIEQGRKDAKLETYNTIIQKLKQSEEKENELTKFFKDEIPSDEQLDILLTKCLEIEKYKGEISGVNIPLEEKETLENLDLLFGNKDITIEKIDKKIADCSEIRDVESKIQNLIIDREKGIQKEKELDEKIKSNTLLVSIMVILSIITIVIGIVLIAMKNKLGIIGLILGLIFIAISIVKINNKKQLKSKEKEQKGTIESLNEVEENLKIKKENIEKEINQFIISYTNNTQDKIIALTEIKTKFNRYKDLKISEENRVAKNADIKAKVELLEESIKEYLEKYFEPSNQNFADLVHELKMRKNELNTVRNELSQAIKLKEEYEKINNVDELKNKIELSDLSENQLEKEIHDLNIDIDTLNDEKNQNKNLIEILENKIDENQELETDIEEMEEKIQELKDKYDLLQKTKKYMETAKEQFSSHYLKGMVQGFRENLKLLNNKEIDTNVDINLGVQIDSNGSQKEIKYFSAGYKDLIYICMRLSLVNVLFEGEQPFIILDDPFVNLDDEKTKKAINLLKEISSKYQVIYFVCNESRI